MIQILNYCRTAASFNNCIQTDYYTALLRRSVLAAADADVKGSLGHIAALGASILKVSFPDSGRSELLD
jgi:hypothetical protein